MLALAEELKADVQDKMKIEMAPWLKGYAADMDELYTELTLEKIDNKSFGPENKMFTEYKFLFEDKLTSTDNEAVNISNDEVKRRRLVRKNRRKKILV